jgi:hypothetical protein
LQPAYPAPLFEQRQLEQRQLEPLPFLVPAFAEQQCRQSFVRKVVPSLHFPAVLFEQLLEHLLADAGPFALLKIFFGLLLFERQLGWLKTYCLFGEYFQLLDQTAFLMEGVEEALEPLLLEKLDQRLQIHLWRTLLCPAVLAAGHT